MKRIFFIIVMICLFLGGCGYGIDVDKQSFVVAIGVDKGEVFPLRVTFLFANTNADKPDSEGGGGGGESSKKADIVTVEAPTVFSATRKLDAIKSKVINLSHTKIVVFSDEIAASGVKKYLSGFASSRDFRPNTYVCVSIGSTQEYLSSVKPNQEKNIEKYYDNIMNKVASDKVNEAYLYYLYFNVEEDFSGSIVPLVGTSKNELFNPDVLPYASSDDLSYEVKAGELLRDAQNPAEILGGAIFRNDQMLGTLGSFDTDLVRIICDEYYPKNYSICYPDNADFVTIRLIQQQSPSIKTKIKNGRVQIKLNVPLSIEFIDAGKIENDKNRSDEFCFFLAGVLNNKAKELISKAQTTYNSDFLGLGDSLKKNFPDMQKWKEFNWSQKYASADIATNFEIIYADFEETN